MICYFCRVKQAVKSTLAFFFLSLYSLVLWARPSEVGQHSHNEQSKTYSTVADSGFPKTHVMVHPLPLHHAMVRSTHAQGTTGKYSFHSAGNLLYRAELHCSQGCKPFGFLNTVVWHRFIATKIIFPFHYFW